MLMKTCTIRARGLHASRLVALAATNLQPLSRLGLSRRAFQRVTTSDRWDVIWDAGPYYERVAELVEKAQSHIVFVGWQIDSRLELTTRRHESFKQLVLRICARRPDLHVYFLMWDYAYFYLFERELLQGWVWDNIHERVHFVFDNRHPYGGSHHEKLVIVDGETALVGGVDLCDDRWDSPRHHFVDARRSLTHDAENHLPYHDMAVEVRGEAAADLLELAGSRWRSVSSIPFPERPRFALSEGRGPYTVLLSRTRASVGGEHPVLVRETEFLFRDLLREARRELVIENQYYWSERMNGELIALMRARAGTGFRIFFVLPSRFGGSLAFRMMSVVQTRLVDELERVARETGTWLEVGCPFVRAGGELHAEKSIYVHSKVIVVDDRYLAIGSSNFNNRGFRMDTEVTLTLVGDTPATRAHIAGIRRKILDHWQQPGIQLKAYHPSWDDYNGTFEGWLARHIDLSRIFDPPVPLNYVLRARLARANLKRLRRAIPIVVCGGLSMQIGLTLLLLGLFGKALGLGVADQLPWVLVYAGVLSAGWLVPLPVSLVALAAGLQLGPHQGALVAASGILVASLVGYGFARMFPGVARGRIARRAVARRLASLVGRRRLPAVTKALFTPFVGFQLKIVQQGVSSIPLRWFVPAALGLAVSGAGLAFVAGGFFRGWP